MLRTPICVAIAALVVLGASPATAGAAVSCPPRAAGSYGDTGAPRDGFPNDPFFDRQFYLEKIRIPSAWNRGFFGDGTIIAVVDSGIDVDHPEFAGRLLPGADTFERQPGKVDCPPGPVVEADGHGTGVAGIAVAGAHNGIGLAGVAPGALILPVRAFDDVEGGESPQAIAAGIRYAADQGAHVINASLTVGITGLDRAELAANRAGVHVLERDVAAVEDAVAYAWARGSIVVAAAGNTEPGVPRATDVPICAAPSYFKNVVCVVAVMGDGSPTPLSHLPIREDGGVVVSAPGFRRSPLVDCESLVTTWPGTMPYGNPNPIHGSDCGRLPRGYTWRSFTSNATPQVAGLVALMRGAGLQPAEILQRLRSTSSNRGRWDPVTGHGMIDAEAALAGRSSPRRTCPGGVQLVRFPMVPGEPLRRPQATLDGHPVPARRRGRAAVRVAVPSLVPGDHLLRVTARRSGGRSLVHARRVSVCTRPSAR